MPENYYSDAAPAEAPAPAAPEAEPKDDGSDSQTAVLPKSVLGGKDFKPGEEVMLQIVQVNEDSVVVKYAEEKGSKEEAEPAPEEAMAPAGGGGGNPMSSMME